VLFMIVERFKDRDPRPVYRHLRDAGRGMPEGLRYIDSWVEPSFERCFQVMECDDAKLLEQWTSRWDDLVDFEIIPVMTSGDAVAAIAPRP
jgi:hypothetical protein